MLFFNVFKSKPQTLIILLYCIMFSLKYSPEILLVKFKQLGNGENQVFFILSIIQGTVSFRIMITMLMTGSLIFCLISILVRKRGIIVLEIFSNLFLPIQTYLTISSINDNQLSAGQTAYFVTTLSISLIIIFCYMSLCDFRTDSPMIIKTCCKWHKMLTQATMLLTGVLSFFLTQNSKTPILIVLLILTLLKTCILLRQINYQSPLIEYSAYLCLPLQWVSILGTFLSMFNEINIAPVLWICFGFIILFAFVQNTTIRFMMQKKYNDFLKNYLELNLSRGNVNDKEFEEKMIIYLALVKEGLISNQKITQQQAFLHYSNHFIHTACSSVNQLYKIIQKRKQAQNNDNASTQYGSNIFVSLDKVVKINQKQSEEQNQNDYAQQYWEAIKQIKQLQNQKYNKLRRYICYSLPQISNAFQGRAIYIHYLNNHDKKDDSNSQFLLGRFEIINKLHNQMDYNFVLQKTKNKKIQQVLLKQDINRKELIGDTLKYSFGYCLKTQASYGSGYFQSFYKQTMYEQTLETTFYQFINAQKQLIEIVASSLPEMEVLIKNLFQINKIKNTIFQTLNKCTHVQSKQFAIHQYILLKYILKLPNLANQKLRLLQLQQKTQEQKHKIVSKTIKSTFLQIKKAQFANNNEAIMMISAVKNKGKIVYGSNSFKQIMQIKSGLNLAAGTNHNVLHLNHLMLPCWVDKHNEIMQKLTIYEKPFHHLGRKYHIKSTVSKNIYQVSFTMHFLTCNMDDLLIALDMKYKKVDFLLITKDNQKVFFKDNDKPNYKRRTSTTTINQGRKLTINDFLGLGSRNLMSQKRKVMSDEVIFEEMYQIVTQYKKGELGSFNQNINDTDTAVSIQNSGIQLEVKTAVSMSKLERDKNQKTIDLQKKVHYYRKNRCMLEKNYHTIVMVIVIVGVVVILLSTLLTILLAQETNKHKLFYQFKHMAQVHYYMVDLESFTSFIMLYAPFHPTINFTSTNSIREFENVWYHKFIDEANTLKTRGQNLVGNSYNLQLFSELQYLSLNQRAQNFLYREQKYEAQYFNLVNWLNLSSQISDNATHSFPNAQKLLNSAQLYELNNLYRESFNQFQEYLQPGSVSSQLSQITSQITSEQIVIIQLFFLLIMFTAIIGLTIFAILYMQYLNRVFHFISHLFEFPAKTIKSLQSELEEFKAFLNQSKDSAEPNPYKTIQTCNSIGTMKKGIFFTNKGSRNPQSKEIKKLSPLTSDCIPALVLFIFLIVFLGLLFISYSLASSQVSLFDQYISGSKALIQFQARSLKIFTCLIDPILFPSKPISPQIPLYISQIKQVNLLTTMQMLEPNSNDLQMQLYQSWYGWNELSIDYIDQEQKRTTMMETLMDSIQLYEIIYSRLMNNPQGSMMDAKLIVQMYKQLGLSRQMIREILEKAQTNYFNKVPEVNLQLVVNVIAVLVLTLIILYWTNIRLHAQTKVLFEETLSLTTIKDIYYVPSLSFHLHEAQRETKYADIF